MKRLVFKSVPDEKTRLAMLKRGEADIAYSIRGPLAEELRRTPGLTLKPTLPTVTDWLVFPEQWDPKSPWADRRVRLAANHAIDRQTSTRRETWGSRRSSAASFPRASSSSGSRRPIRTIPARAKRLLTEAGYPNGFDAGDYHVRRRLRHDGEAAWLPPGGRDPREAPAAGARGLLSRPNQERS